MTKPDFSGLTLAEIARLAGEATLPPVARWTPDHCGDSEMRIARDGRWWHQGSPIDRPELARLFSTLLRREADGRIVLVTPVEKLDIEVEDLPFRAVELSSEGEGRDRRIAFRLDSDDLVVAGPGHAIRVDTDADGAPSPSLHVRDGLEARIVRPVFYELAELALAEGAEPAGLWSGGTFFPLGPAA